MTDTTDPAALRAAERILRAWYPVSETWNPAIAKATARIIQEETACGEMARIKARCEQYEKLVAGAHAAWERLDRDLKSYSEWAAQPIEPIVPLDHSKEEVKA